MEAKNHIYISSFVAPLAVLLTTDVTTVPVFTALYFLAVAAGVLIDLDHFFVFRLETGDWRDLRKALNNPLKVLNDYSTLTVFSTKKKYTVHTFSVTAITLASYILLPQYWVLVVSMLAVHLLSDLYASFRKGNFPFHMF